MACELTQTHAHYMLLGLIVACTEQCDTLTSCEADSILTEKQVRGEEGKPKRKTSIDTEEVVERRVVMRSRGGVKKKIRADLTGHAAGTAAACSTAACSVTILEPALHRTHCAVPRTLPTSGWLLGGAFGGALSLCARPPPAPPRCPAPPSSMPPGRAPHAAAIRAGTCAPRQPPPPTR